MSTLPTDPLAVAAPAFSLDSECAPTYDNLVTEDHKPVERILVEKLYRLLTHPLYASWPYPERPFLVLANVGWFYKEKTPAVVPDCLLSLDVSCPENLRIKQGHSYYQWLMGKPPDVIVEVVSDKLGGEDTFKKTLYASQGVSYYAIYDPNHFLTDQTLRTLERHGKTYQPTNTGPWPEVGLGLRLWEGTFEGHHDTWLRWCDANGTIIPTGEERASNAEERASNAEERIRVLEAELRRLKGE